MNSVKISMNRIKLILAVPFNTYNQMLERRPLLTKSVTTGIFEDDEEDDNNDDGNEGDNELTVMRIMMMMMMIIMMMMMRFVI
jgi:hypothetical protein